MPSVTALAHNDADRQAIEFLYAGQNIGRPFVAPDDIRAVAPSVLAHRLVLHAEAEDEPKGRERVVEEALATVSYRRGMRAV